MNHNGFCGRDGIPGIWRESVVPTFQEGLHSALLEDQVAKRFEALSQAEQVDAVAERMNAMDGLRYENWEKLTLDERLEALQEIENAAAAASCRTPMKITPATYQNTGQVVTMGQMDWANRQILINADVLRQDSFQCYSKCLNTVLHEGRHAYQWSNVYEQRTEPGDERYQSWVMNLETGYVSAERFGFAHYCMQPVELDAREFAEDVLAKVNYR